MELARIAEYFNNITNIPTAIVSKAGLEAEYGIRSFKSSLSQFYIRSILNHQTNIPVDVTLTDDQVICGYVVDLKSSKALILGPVMEHPCSRRTAVNILQQIHLSYRYIDELMLYFEKIPNIPLTSFIQNLFFLHYILNDQLPPTEDWYVQVAADLEAKHHTPVPAEKLAHNPREWDRKLESCIEYGKLDELEDFLPHIRAEGRMGITADDSIRSLKNIAISSIALVSRAAARGGMEYEAALTLSDKYIWKIEALDSYDALSQLLIQSFFDFASIVAKIRRLNSDSKLVYSIAGYVKKHLYEPIQVSQIAQDLDYNASYLCRSFKEETGKTLKEYINEVKMEEAKFMLQSTDRAIIDIAMDLGYSSQAYFTTLFKSYSGTTPMSFRENNS